MNITQVQAGQSALLTLTAYSDGTQTDQGTFTIGVVDANGDTVVSSGTAVTDNSDGTYEYSLATQDDPAFLTVTWTESGGNLTYTTYVEVVGNVLFTEAAARAFDDGRLSDTTKYTDTEIIAERARITDWLEAQTAISWIPRYRRVTLRGNGRDCLSLRNPIKSEGGSGGEGSRADVVRILSVTIDGTDQDVADFEIERSKLWYDGGVFSWARRPNVVVEYEYGKAHPQNGVDRVALLELVDRLPTSRVSRSASSFNSELGTFSWDPQNNGRPSRVPEVNAWVRAHDQRVAIA